MIDMTTWAGADPDLDPLFGEVPERRAIVEAVARRWLLPRGALWFDTDAGTDVRKSVQAKFTAARLRVLEIQLADEARKDERVEDAKVTVTQSSTGALAIEATIEQASDGAEVRFTLAVGAVTGALLTEGITT
jgi:hypothetical protein